MIQKLVASYKINEAQAQAYWESSKIKKKFSKRFLQLMKSFNHQPGKYNILNQKKKSNSLKNMTTICQ